VTLYTPDTLLNKTLPIISCKGFRWLAASYIVMGVIRKHRQPSFGGCYVSREEEEVLVKKF
jgi:hypothetical protein